MLTFADSFQSTFPRLVESVINCALILFLAKGGVRVCKRAFLALLTICLLQSGSTGNPKGVVLTHGNLVNSLAALLVISSYAVGDVRDDDIHIAFLPLAHVLELLAENAYIILGVAIGYSSPNTLLDTSTAIKRGQVSVRSRKELRGSFVGGKKDYQIVFHLTEKTRTF